MAGMSRARTIEAGEILEAFERMAEKIAAVHRETPKLGVLGISDGGLVFSRRLAATLTEKLGRSVPVGTINISFQRDDIATKPIPKATEPTSIPFDIEGSTIILVDDVLSTGRSLRAAINEIFDQGRPERVQVAVVFDRGGRLLPFRADFVGFREDVDHDCKVEVRLSETDPATDEINILESVRK